MMILLAVACAIHQTGAKAPEAVYVNPSDIPIGACALVAIAGSPAYSKPVASPEYQVAKLNWGAFLVVESSSLPAEGGWMAIATDIGAETGAQHRSIMFVRTSTMTFDVSRSTMSPGDAEEIDWSKCTNMPANW